MITCTHEYYNTSVPCNFPICPCFEIYDIIFWIFFNNCDINFNFSNNF